VIPQAAVLLQSYSLFRQQHGGAPASQLAVETALRRARELVRDEADEPAALLFAFATYRRAFPAGWRFMAQSIAYE
jgi:hypothetical protein